MTKEPGEVGKHAGKTYQGISDPWLPREKQQVIDEGSREGCSETGILNSVLEVEEEFCGLE